MKKGRLLSTILILALIMSFIIVPSCGNEEQAKKEDEVIKIGAILPMTGEASVYGENTKDATELYKKLNNKSWDIYYYDSQGKSKNAVTGINYLHNKGYNIILGPLFSSEAKAIAQILESNGQIAITPTASHTDLTNYSSILRVCESDSQEASFLAKSLHKKDINKVDCIVWQSDWGIGFYNNFKKHYEGKIINNLTYKSNQKNFKNILQKLDDNADYILIVGYNEVPQILKQLKDLKISKKLIGTSMFESGNILDQVEKYKFDYLYVSRLPNESSTYKKINQDYEEEYNKTMDIMATLMYDACILLDTILPDGYYNFEKVKFISGINSLTEQGDLSNTSYLNIKGNTE